MKPVFVLIALTLSGCFQASGRSEIVLSGEAEVRHTLDISICNQVEDPAAKQECIKTVLDILADATKESQ